MTESTKRDIQRFIVDVLFPSLSGTDSTHTSPSILSKITVELPRGCVSSRRTSTTRRERVSPTTGPSTASPSSYTQRGQNGSFVSLERGPPEPDSKGGRDNSVRNPEWSLRSNLSLSVPLTNSLTTCLSSVTSLCPVTSKTRRCKRTTGVARGLNTGFRSVSLR